MQVSRFLLMGFVRTPWFHGSTHTRNRPSRFRPYHRKFYCSDNFTVAFKSVFVNAQSWLRRGSSLKKILTLDFMKVKPSAKHHLDFKSSDHVYLGNLPSNYTRKDVAKLLAPHVGPAGVKRIHMKQRSPNSTLHCFVWLSDSVTATACIENLDGSLLQEANTRDRNTRIRVRIIRNGYV